MPDNLTTPFISSDQRFVSVPNVTQISGVAMTAKNLSDNLAPTFILEVQLLKVNEEEDTRGQKFGSDTQPFIYIRECEF